MTDEHESDLSGECPAQANFYATHYRSGEEIRTGDRIYWGGRPGHVVFVLGSSNVPEDWTEAIDWFVNEYREGIILDTDLAGLVFQHESDEDLEFIGRRS